MQIAQEQLSDKLCEEITQLVSEYYDKTAASTGIPPYDFDWARYKVLDDAGMLFLLTARDHGVLVGLVLYAVTTNPHHKTVLVADCDTLATRLSHRKRGIGAMLCEIAFTRLKDMGVKLIAHRFRTCYTEQPLFEQLGFTCAEHVYVKEL
jgi:GNAT superfamily N-acetyltransferase